MGGENVRLLRQQLRAGVLASGSSAAQADQAVDLAFHAADQAMRRLSEILLPLAPLGTTWGIATSIALQILPIACAGRLAELAEHCDRQGDRTSTFVVGTDAGTIQ